MLRMLSAHDAHTKHSNVEITSDFELKSVSWGQVTKVVIRV